MVLTGICSHFVITVSVYIVSFEAIPLGDIKHNGAEHAPCVSNSGSHVLLPQPGALGSLNMLI